MVSRHDAPPPYKILRDFEFNWPSVSQIDDYSRKFEKYRDDTDTVSKYIFGRISPAGKLEKSRIDKSALSGILNNNNFKNWFSGNYIKWGLLRLDGRSRFDLTNDHKGGDLLKPATNVLSHLFQDDNTRYKVRSIIKDAFGLNFVVDPTDLGNLRIRLSENDPPKDEQSLSYQSRNYYKDSTYIKDASDGVQAFTGIVTAILCAEYHTILVDEPEAFLHPPLARKLGKHLAKIATSSNSALMASTHSADFLMGCVQTAKDVRVIRLEHSNGKSKGKIVDSDTLSRFFRSPLMRSANAISSLFYDGVIITESDNDRAFYSEIYYRLAELDENYPSVLFINAQNKQTIKDIMGPLRDFGVPAAAITDVDIIKDGGKTWTEWMRSAQIPSSSHESYGVQRGIIKSVFEKSGIDMKSGGGVSALKGGDKQSATDFFDILNQYGIFSVRNGELENWLQNLNVPGKKTDWTIAMLERLGGEPDGSTYIKPSAGDVWDFVRGIVSWISDPSRRGTT